MASRFWVGGTGTWDNATTTHWAASSNGPGGQSVPGSGDTVTFDGSSGGGTVTPNYDMTVISITTGAFTGTLDFSANNNNPTMGTFSGTGTGTRVLNLGSGTFTLTGITTPWSFITTTNLTFNAGTSTIKITASSSNEITFSGGGQTYYNLWWSRGSSTGLCDILGSNTFNDFKDDGTGTHTIQFKSGTTQTVTTFTVSGIAGHLISLGSYDGLDPNTLTHALVKSGGGVISCDYLAIAHSVATPSSTWYAGANSTDNQATATAGSGWIFTAPSTTSIKTIDGLAYASTKTVDGLAIASVKTYNGLA